jgi:bloom syndrome protein
MTRHNLAIHLSWLLSQNVTPPTGGPVDVQTPSTTNLAAEFANTHILENRDEPELLLPTTHPSPSRNRALEPTVNVFREFVRPKRPPIAAPRQQPRDITNAITDDTMGRLSSAPRPTRPGLISQYQLATPASTVASSATKPSSLRQNYTAMLMETNSQFKIQNCSSIFN